MLQVIEEQIMLKRASLALKTVAVKKETPRCFAEESNHPVESIETLRVRVNRILQFQKRDITVNHLEVTSRRCRVPVQYDHPLRRRVKAVLQQRFAPLSVELQKSEAPPAPLQKEPSPVKDEVKKSEQGFMRFLSILNKGVDIDKLTEIVNGESGDIPQSSQNGVQINSAPSSSISPSMEMVRLKDEKQSQKTGEQQKHIQSILESLGLSLGRDEISYLANRTQERLYGKKQKAEREKIQTEAQQIDMERYSPARYTRSSSSSSSSTSHSGTPSPIKRRRSRSPRHSGRRRSWSPRRRKHSRSRYRTRDSCSKQKSKSLRPRDCQESHHRHMYPTQPYSHPQYFNPHFSPQMYHNAYVYSQYTAYYNYWIQNQAALVSPIVFSTQNYMQNILPALPDPQTGPHENDRSESSSVAQNQKEIFQIPVISQMHREHATHGDMKKWEKFEIKTKQRIQDKLEGRKKKKKKKKRMNLLDDKPELGTKDSQEVDLYDDILLNMKGIDTGGGTGDSEVEEPKPKPQLTDEEVKANLKKVLDAFNSRTKKNVIQPPGFMVPQNLKEDESLQ